MTSLPPAPMSLKRRASRWSPACAAAPCSTMRRRRAAGGGSPRSTALALARDMVRAGLAGRRMGRLCAVRRAARPALAGATPAAVDAAAHRPARDRSRGGRSQVDGPALWRRSEPGTSDELAEALAADIAAWSRVMRRLTAFACEGATLAAQPRRCRRHDRPAAGHRRQPDPDRLAPDVRKARQGAGRQGYPCFRFDRRGVGDSEGEDPGFRGSGPDLAAAGAASARECPALDPHDRLRPVRRRHRARPVRRRSRARRPDPGQSLAGRDRGRRAAARRDPPALSQAAAQPSKAGRNCSPAQ